MSRNDVLQYFSRRRVERCAHDSDHMARRDTFFVDLCRPAMSSIIRKSSGDRPGGRGGKKVEVLYHCLTVMIVDLDVSVNALLRKLNDLQP